LHSFPTRRSSDLFLFDDRYAVIQKQQTTLEQIEDDDGDACEDLSSLESWIQDRLHEVVQNPAYDLQKLNFSGYGATLAHLDREGHIATPIDRKSTRLNSSHVSISY